MIDMKIEFEGGKELANELQELPRRLQNKTLGTALRQSGNVILAKMRAMAPVKTGALKRGIKLNVSLKGTPAAIINVRIPSKGGKAKSSDGPYYAAFVELGTSKMAPHPFMRPAFDVSANNALDAFVEALNDGLDEETKLL